VRGCGPSRSGTAHRGGGLGHGSRGYMRGTG
jgi:hypothetical protein